ncbi:MAG: hypothetical protein M3P14_10285 [Chloroflexota bacterium]|nr:hypothetical protein [Chloroflexota bacterium]
MVEPPPATPCVELNYQPASRFGIVFTVRNNGPLPMTLTRFEPQGAVEPALYELDSAIVGSAAGTPSPAFAAFEPLTIPPFGEVPVALVGSFATCEAIGDSWSPGGYGGVTTVSVNVRWGLMSIDHYVVLPAEVHFRAPDADQCQ